MAVNKKISADAAHATADALAARNASASDPVVVQDAPTPKLAFVQADYDRMILSAVSAAAPIVNVGLALYETAGRPTMEVAQYRQSTADVATPATFDLTMWDIAERCNALFFDTNYAPDNAIRAVIFIDENVKLGIPAEVSRRVPLRRMLAMFANCYVLDKVNATGSIRAGSAEYIKANVEPNAIPEHKPGDKKPKAQVKPGDFEAGLSAHYAEARKVDPVAYPAKKAKPVRKAAPKPGSGKPGRDWAKFKPKSARKLVEGLSKAGNAEAINALIAALQAIASAPTAPAAPKSKKDRKAA